MKKLLIISITSFVLLVGLTYTVLFTGFGNTLLKPLIQAKINESSPLRLELTQFHLDMSTLSVILAADADNTFELKGDYSLFSQDFNMKYKLEFSKLSKLSDLAQRKLSGSISTKGTIKGNLDKFKVQGDSDLASSATTYAIHIQNLELSKAAIKLQDAKLQELLSMVGEKAYAIGKLDLHVQLHDLNPKNLKGSVSLNIKDASLNKKLLQQDLGLHINKTALSGRFKAKLEGSDISYLAKINSELAKFDSKGLINIEEKNVDSTYSLDIKELALLKSITNAPLRGPFFTQGSIKGTQSAIKIIGDSNLAASKTSYSLVLQNQQPQELILKIKDASLEKLLYMGGQDKFANATLNVNINIPIFDIQALSGKANIDLTKGKINTKIMKKSFDVNLPKTNFELHTDVNLKPDNINYTLSFLSNLAKISSQGNIHPNTLETKLTYNLNIKKLSLLKPITNAPFRGPLSTKGSLSGNKEKLLLKGSSNLAHSKTSYSLIIKDLEPSSALLSIKEAKLSKLLYLGGQAPYAEGILDLNVDMKSLASLNANINLKIKKGIVHKQAVKKDFNISLPYTKFELKNEAKIKNDIVTASTTINSNLAVLSMKKTKIDMKTSFMDTDYDISFPSLERLEPILEQKLYGKFNAHGTVQSHEKLTILAKSKIFKGSFDAKIVDEKVSVNFKKLQAQDILKMLGYPEVVSAPVSGTLLYNTTSKKGKLNSTFSPARLTRSKMTDLVGSLTKSDLSKEPFHTATLISHINKDIITSTLNMQAKKASIKSKKFIINSKKQVIDARFALKVKQYPADVIVKGKIASPSVKIDAKSMITPEVEKKVKKELNRFLKKLF